MLSLDICSTHAHPARLTTCDTHSRREHTFHRLSDEMLKQVFNGERMAECLYCQTAAGFRGRLGLTLTSYSSWGSHYMGDWVPGSGPASSQHVV